MDVNPLVDGTEFPPVTEAAGWIRDRTFPTDLPLIDVSQAVPGYPTSDDVLDHMASVLREPSVSKYGHALGLPALRTAYADHLNAEDNHVKDTNVAITAGCNQAFHVAITALAAAGDQVILPSPWYFNHKMSLDMLGIEAVPLPCSADQHMIPNTTDAESLINKRTRAIVLITPNNPTGQEFPAAVVDAFYELCKKHHIMLILDETYCDFRKDTSATAHTVFSDPDWHDTAIHLYSFSKSYALAGYRVGAIVASEKFLVQVTKVLDCVSICAPQLSQRAALFALRNADAWKQEKCAQMVQRARAFSEALNTNDHGYQITAMGSYFAYLEHPFDLPARNVARFLADEANLLALPGEMFGPGQEKHIRVAFANVSRRLMPAIAERIGHFRPANPNI